MNLVLALSVPPYLHLPRSFPFPASQEIMIECAIGCSTDMPALLLTLAPTALCIAWQAPPIEIHVDPSAKLVAVHTPASIPLHWQDKVHENLLRDEAVGILERVPHGEPTLWCHRMVITRKHDGSPRRTVDFSSLNKFCRRETFAAEAPFKLARRIPRNTWKTVTDA